MRDMYFVMIAIAFVLVAFLFAVTTLNAGPTVSRIANKVIYGSCGAALVSAVLASWFFFLSPA